MTMKKQSGFVSIIVAAVLMILLSLITIGFTQLMQREQRQALDRQLSTQAYYAAETAVNIVRDRIQNAPATLVDEKVGCNLDDWNNGVIDTSTPTVAFTCLEYDRTPLDLVYTNTIVPESSKVFPIDTDSNIGSVTFYWDGLNGSTTINPGSIGACPSIELPASFDSGSIPMLRVDLIKTPNVGVDITRNDLIDNTSTLYLYPKNCGDTSLEFDDYIGENSGRIVNVNCSSGCSMTVNMLTPDSNRYYARVKSIYGNVGTLRVTATDGSGTPQELKNAQALVDATGKANDVLRRIEVRLASAPNYEWPEAVIETSNGLCKLLKVAPPESVTDSNCYIP